MSTATLEAPAPVTRDARHRSFVPPDELALHTALIIGAGAIGRHVALMLAGLGMPRIALCDHDTVELVNLNPQGWNPADIGQYKVDILADSIRAHNPDIKVFPLVSRFGRAFWSSPSFLEMHKPDDGDKLAVFMCVDQMSARQFIWNECKGRASFLVDGRMSGETIRIITARNPGEDKYYETTLFADSDAFQGGCTAQSTNYASTFAAGHMVTQFTKYLRNFITDRDFMHNVLSNELFTTE